MKQSNDLIHRLSQKLHQPAEAMQLLPLIEVAGDRRVLVENHRGVQQYTPQCICIRVSFGDICVSGEALRLAQMSAGQLTIYGQIDSVKLCRREG